MATPCPKCGTTKTESVRHGFIYNQLWSMGYHLRRCSFCNRKRIFKRHEKDQKHPDDLTAEELTEHFNRRIAQAKGIPYVPPVSTGAAFVAAPAPPPAEDAGELITQPSAAAVGVVEIPEESEDYQLCPKCGSTSYRRSHRRWYEKLLNSPKMARCRKCDHRFPYPK